MHLLTYLRDCRCQQSGCGGLLRPHVVWFGESLESAVLCAADDELQQCDLCLVVCILCQWISHVLLLSLLLLILQTEREAGETTNPVDKQPKNCCATELN